MLCLSECLAIYLRYIWKVKSQDFDIIVFTGTWDNHGQCRINIFIFYEGQFSIRKTFYFCPSYTLYLYFNKNIIILKLFPWGHAHSFLHFQCLQHSSCSRSIYWMISVNTPLLLSIPISPSLRENGKRREMT